MHELAAFVGRLIGTMIDPALWLVVGLVVWQTSRFGAVVQVAAAVGAALLLAACIFALFPDPTGRNLPRALFFTAAGAAAWACIFIGVARLWRGKGASRIEPT